MKSAVLHCCYILLAMHVPCASCLVTFKNTHHHRRHHSIRFASPCDCCYDHVHSREVSTPSTTTSTTARPTTASTTMCTTMSRRHVLLAGVLPTCFAFATIASTIEPAVAIGEGEQRMVLIDKPKAPLAALIPAAQQRLLLEQCLVLLTTKIMTSPQTQNGNDENNSIGGDDDNDSTRLQYYRQQFESKLIDPNAPLPPTLSSNKKRTKSNIKDLNIMLRYEPNQILNGDMSRAVMNIYTANLRYGNDPRYEVTDPNWKKSYIRANDGLPDVTRVITADLDIRDLYRNRVQLLLDDAAAEYYATGDLEEVALLLKQAAAAYDEWLSKIDEEDVRQALQAALDGGVSVKVYEPYRAGFVPPP